MKTVILFLSVIFFFQFMGCNKNDNAQIVTMSENQIAIYKNGFVYIIYSPRENLTVQRKIEIENFDK